MSSPTSGWPGTTSPTRTRWPSPQPTSGVTHFIDSTFRLNQARAISIALLRPDPWRRSEFALACDMRFASREQALLGQPEVGVGIPSRRRRRRAIDHARRSCSGFGNHCQQRRLRRHDGRAVRLGEKSPSPTISWTSTWIGWPDVWPRSTPARLRLPSDSFLDMRRMRRTTEKP